jgi:uncharacterized protein
MFEFDQSKSKSNRDKHGIDFLEAQALWNDANLLEIPAKTVDETRFVVIGKIELRHWSAVVTYRNEIIRIISVRRSRDEEVKLYES